MKSSSGRMKTSTELELAKLFFDKIICDAWYLLWCLGSLMGEIIILSDKLSEESPAISVWYAWVYISLMGFGILVLAFCVNVMLWCLVDSGRGDRDYRWCSSRVMLTFLMFHHLNIAIE